jgi:hypothetical protein
MFLRVTSAFGIAITVWYEELSVRSRPENGTFQGAPTGQMAHGLTDLEIAVLCDLLQGPDVNLRAHKRAVLEQLISKGLVELTNDGGARYQLSHNAHHILAEGGVGIGEG